MKKFVCLLLAVATCKASFDGGYSSEILGNYGHQGYDYSVPTHTVALAEGHGDLGGQGYGGQGYGGQVYGGQGFGGQSYGGHIQDFGGQLGGHGGAEESQEYNGDSYLQAAHESQGLHEDGGHGGQGGQQLQIQTFTLQDAGQDYGHGQELGAHVQDLGAEIHDLGPQYHGFAQNFGEQQQYGGHDLGHAQAIPVGEHVDVESPVEVPLYKHVTYPVHKPIHVNVPKPILVGVPQPYPVKVPIHKPVAVPVETEISIPIEKPVPYPVVKHVPYPVEKHVPIKVEKTVTVHVPQPYPVKIPIYKTIHHHKGHH